MKPDPTKDRLVGDGGGLYVRVFRTGRKAWLFVHQREGKAHWHTLGEVGGALSADDTALYGLPADARLDLANARHAASVCAAQVRAGINPGERHREAAEARRADALEARTVRDVSKNWMTEVIAATHKHPERMQEMLDRHVLPHLGGMRIERLRRAHVAEVISTLVQAGKRSTANHVLLAIKQLLRFAHERGYVEADPVAVMTRKAAGGREKARDRNLSFDELATFVRLLWLDDFPADPITRGLLQFVALTGQRVGETAAAEWAHFDLDKREWNIPPENAKSERAHVVHLSDQAIEVLREVQRHTKLKTFAFNSPRGDKSIDPHSLARIIARLFADPEAAVDPRKRDRPKPKAARLHARIKRPVETPTLFGAMAPFTPHDLRRTMASRMGDMGVAPHVIEKCLNHALEGVLAVYQRAEWLPERRAALEAWGRKIADLRAADPAKVVHLPSRKAA